MAMTSLSIVLTVFVLQLHHVGPNTKPVPRWNRRIVVGLIARAICMQSHIRGYYGSKCRPDRPAQSHNTSGSGGLHREEMCLTSFMESSMDYKDTNNCNGRLGQQIHLAAEMAERELGQRNVSYDRISKHLKILVSKHDSEEEYQDIINEWRLIAQIMDRFLFWLFLIGSTLSSVSILVFKPMGKPIN